MSNNPEDQDQYHLQWETLQSVEGPSSGPENEPSLEQQSRLGPPPFQQYLPGRSSSQQGPQVPMYEQQGSQYQEPWESISPMQFPEMHQEELYDPQGSSTSQQASQGSQSEYQYEQGVWDSSPKQAGQYQEMLQEPWQFPEMHQEELYDPQGPSTSQQASHGSQSEYQYEQGVWDLSLQQAGQYQEMLQEPLQHPEMPQEPYHELQGPSTSQQDYQDELDEWFLSPQQAGQYQQIPQEPTHDHQGPSTSQQARAPPQGYENQQGQVYQQQGQEFHQHAPQYQQFPHGGIPPQQGPQYQLAPWESEPSEDQKKQLDALIIDALILENPNQLTIRPLNTADAFVFLNKVPNLYWGSAIQKRNALKDFDDWRQKNLPAQFWLARNILMMKENLFEATIVQGRMEGLYSFAAYVRMLNFMRWNHYERCECMALGNMNKPPVFKPDEVNLNWFSAHRINHQHLELTEELARQYLERSVVIDNNAMDTYRTRLDASPINDQYWIAANIRGRSVDHMFDEVSDDVEEMLVKTRIQNWISMHPSWRSEVLNLAIVPVSRRAVTWNPREPEDLDCLHDDPSVNPDIPISPMMAEAYLNNTPAFPFTHEQTIYLYDLWVKKHPALGRWLRRCIATRELDLEELRMQNWLQLHSEWKNIFIENVWPESL